MMCDLQDAQTSSETAPFKPTKRNFVIGVLLACCIGVTNGSFLVPLKYAQKDVKGIIYLLSFGIGAALVCFPFPPYCKANRCLLQPAPTTCAP